MDFGSHLGDLPLEVERCLLKGLQRKISRRFLRETTEVVLFGAGQTGHGEEVGFDRTAQASFQACTPLPGLPWQGTLDGFSHFLERHLLGSPSGPGRSGTSQRRWAFESAAFDLALRQTGQGLPEILGWPARPVHFVHSPRLSRPPFLEPFLRRAALAPGIRFKLDADPSWDDSFLETLAAWGRVACLDLKSAGQAGAGIPRGRLDFFRKLTVLFPEAWIEDPPLFPEDRPLWEANWNRISWDAPIRSVEDILRLPRLPAGINVKPSRIGSLERLFAVYAFCLREGISLYGGGMFEIGVGRRQLAILAAMFHPEAPNDVAPSAWHTEVPGPGLPDSPLTHPVPRVGFH